MREKRSGKPSTTSCSHINLCFNPSVHAARVGYRRPTFQQRIAATTTDGREPPKIDLDGTNPGTFPAPLVLSGDDLSLDPKYPPQSVRAWIRGKDRNKITPQRKTIYVAAPPVVDAEVDFVRSWTEPTVNVVGCGMPIGSPKVHDIVQYLSSFYYGLPVKLLSTAKLRFNSWDDTGVISSSRLSKEQDKSKPKGWVEREGPEYIGLATSTEVVRIRTRSSLSPAFRRQINLNDLIDAAISVLPDDAYALLLLVEHDLFEDEDDEFVCGRAYGGSRVAVVSSARYHPGLDQEQGVEREHAWPASHCEQYLNLCCSNDEELQSISTKPKEARKKKETGISTQVAETDASEEFISSPFDAAVAVHRAQLSFDSASTLEGLWLGRVCKTASHELGHCFGIDHCIYYACIMQGSASLAEDARQPPYLCPIDEAKVASATGKGVRERRTKMIEFCNKERSRDILLFKALRTWLSKIEE